MPPPSITWYKDAALVEVARLSRFRQRSDGGLQISGLVPDDTGMFQCFARNAAGEVQTSTYLAVTSKSGPCRPAPEPLPPRAQPLCSRPGASRERRRDPSRRSRGRLRPLHVLSRVLEPRTESPALSEKLLWTQLRHSLLFWVPSRAGLRPRCPSREDSLTSLKRRAST